MKRGCNREETSVFAIFNLPIELFASIVLYYFDPLSMWRLCACSSATMAFVLEHVDIFKVVYDKLTMDPRLYLRLSHQTIWKGGSSHHKPGVRHGFAVWYNLKYRALLSLDAFGAHSHIVAFNALALRIHRLFFTLHGDTESMLPDLCDISTDSSYGNRSLYMLPQRKMDKSLRRLYKDLCSCAVIVYHVTTFDIVFIRNVKCCDVENVLIETRMKYKGSFTYNVASVASLRLGKLVEAGISEAIISNEIRKVIVTANRDRDLGRGIIQELHRQLYEFYCVHVINIKPSLVRCEYVSDSADVSTSESSVSSDDSSLFSSDDDHSNDENDRRYRNYIDLVDDI